MKIFLIFIKISGILSFVSFTILYIVLISTRKNEKLSKKIEDFVDKLNPLALFIWGYWWILAGVTYLAVHSFIG